LFFFSLFLSLRNLCCVMLCVQMTTKNPTQPKSTDAAYISSGNEERKDRNQLSHMHPVTLGPPGVSDNDITEPLMLQIEAAAVGLLGFKVADEQSIVVGAVVAALLDMPQKHSSCGLKGHQSIMFCGNCGCPTDAKLVFEPDQENKWRDFPHGGQRSHEILQQQRLVEASDDGKHENVDPCVKPAGMCMFDFLTVFDAVRSAPYELFHQLVMCFFFFNFKSYLFCSRGR
jgi:hypothetical protein